MALVSVVTGFVDISNHPRGAADYKVLGEQLLKAVEPYEALVWDNDQMKVEHTWLARYTRTIANLNHAVADNPEKNTLAYHCVQHQKFEWLAAAAEAAPKADVYVWIDYGIFHVPGVTAAVIQQFLGRIENYGHAVVMPGCWPKRHGEVSNQTPCWRFCGGVIAVPRPLMKSFTRLVMGVAARQIAETKIVEWEVNTLARLELLEQVPIMWYKADHDASIFGSLP